MTHYNFLTCETSGLEENGSLLTLKVTARPWEFVQLLSTGTIQDEIKPGEVYLRSYLRIQRDQYLQQQLALEQNASEIIIHTTTVTNALSPDEYFELISRDAIKDMFLTDSFSIYSEEKVQKTLDAMKGRRDHLLKLITSPDSETKVTTLFHYHGVKREIQKWKEVDASPTLSENEKKKILLKCKISISKYAKVALLANSFMRRNSSLEIRIVDSEKYNLEKLKEIQRETFALIRLKGGTDEAICYADQASSPDERNIASHLVNVNGDEVANKRKVYEKSRLVAWSNEDSILKLATAIMKENHELKSRYGIDAIDKKDMTGLEQLTRISHKFRSELDAGYFERVGEGSFGYVYQAKKGGRPVAVKILKDKEADSKHIENFEREVEMLKQANHPRIVEVISIYISKKNELSIVMEFMAGGNLKDYLKEHGGQGKIFTVRFIEDIGSAIDHLHSLDIMHRDVKPENIFLSEDHKVLKLGDFGLARATEGTGHTKTAIGSYRYMAPEVISTGGHYSKKADVHSFGLCLIEVLSGKTVYAGIERDKSVFDIKMSGVKPSIPSIPVEKFGKEMAMKITNIIKKCLEPEEFRPDMRRILSTLRKKSSSSESRSGWCSLEPGTSIEEQDSCASLMTETTERQPLDSSQGTTGKVRVNKPRNTEPSDTRDDSCSDTRLCDESLNYDNSPYPTIEMAMGDNPFSTLSTYNPSEEQSSGRHRINESETSMPPSIETDESASPKAQETLYGPDSPYPNISEAIKSTQF
ncbi:uncharacterized protein [Montipora foliosa]|uniref:uncharacterized protein n=1 Tax=Montipora foliosa TaxID=591990 RepID=UPI0035F1F39C